jgi:hypothetical protein
VQAQAGAWVTAVPSTDDGIDTVMKPQVFRIAAANRLGVQVVPQEISCPLISVEITLLAAGGRVITRCDTIG